MLFIYLRFIELKSEKVTYCKEVQLEKAFEILIRWLAWNGWKDIFIKEEQPENIPSILVI